MATTDWVVTWTSLSLIVWFILFELITDWVFKRCSTTYLDKLDQRERVRWRYIFASTLHALFVGFGAAYVLLTNDVVWSKKFLYVDQTTNVLSIGSAGYTIYALTIMLVTENWKRCWVMLIHHLVCIIGLWYNMVYSVSSFYMVARMLTELSTPFVDARRLMRGSGLPSNHQLVIVTTILYGLTFAVFQVIFQLPVLVSSVNELTKLAQINLVTLPVVICATIEYLINLLTIKWSREVVGLTRGAIGHLTTTTVNEKNQND